MPTVAGGQIRLVCIIRSPPDRRATAGWDGDTDHSPGHQLPAMAFNRALSRDLARAARRSGMTPAWTALSTADT